MNIIFNVLCTNILTFYLLHVISTSAKVIAEDAKAIYRHLWAHKSYVLILEVSLLCMLFQAVSIIHHCTV